jgi:hypothetical protein
MYFNGIVGKTILVIWAALFAIGTICKQITQPFKFTGHVPFTAKLQNYSKESKAIVETIFLRNYGFY